MNKNEKTGLIIGSIAAAVASVAGCLATIKAVKEIKEDLHEVALVSPSGNNMVSVNRGTSAIGLTYIKLVAENEELARRVASYEANMRMSGCANNYL